VHLLIIALLVLGLIFGPGLWVRSVMARYSIPKDRYPGTGGQMARHLLDALDLKSVAVEETDKGDHYDPMAKAVRLTPANYATGSLTAITVAAHEVGHAVQDAYSYPPLKWRTRLVTWMGPAEKVGAGLLMASPFLVAITRVPAAGMLAFIGGFLTLGVSTVIHLMTLPTEFDASFSRAMPMLVKGEVLRPEDVSRARRLLTAAALTYVSASLMSLLNIARWWAILRR
jgi:Zn-dependent membrane protease YugP